METAGGCSAGEFVERRLTELGYFQPENDESDEFGGEGLWRYLNRILVAGCVTCAKEFWWSMQNRYKLPREVATKVWAELAALQFSANPLPGSQALLCSLFSEGADVGFLTDCWPYHVQAFIFNFKHALELDKHKPFTSHWLERGTARVKDARGLHVEKARADTFHMFHKLRRMKNFDDTRIAVVSDSVECDILPAQEFGWRTFTVNREGAPDIGDKQLLNSLLAFEREGMLRCG